jgi:hypothetical protein
MCVVDLYDNNSSGLGAERLPREVVLEYTWQEVVPWQTTRQWPGVRRVEREDLQPDCGGTLVFDERNLLSWFRKPGTEHITEAEEGRSWRGVRPGRKTRLKRNSRKLPPTRQELGAG